MKNVMMLVLNVILLKLMRVLPNKGCLVLVPNVQWAIMHILQETHIVHKLVIQENIEWKQPKRVKIVMRLVLSAMAQLQRIVHNVL